MFHRHCMAAAFLLLATTGFLASTEAQPSCSGKATAMLVPVSSAAYVNTITQRSTQSYTDAPVTKVLANHTCPPLPGVVLSVDIKPATVPGKPASVCLWWLGKTSAYCPGASFTPVCLDLQPDGTFGAKVSALTSTYDSKTTYDGATLTLLPNGQLRLRVIDYALSDSPESSSWESAFTRFDVRLRVVQGCLFNQTICKRKDGTSSYCTNCQSCVNGPKAVCPANTYRSRTQSGACLPCKPGTTSPEGSEGFISCLPIQPPTAAAKAFTGAWTCLETTDSRMGRFLGTPIRWNGAHPECASVDGKTCLLPSQQACPPSSPQACVQACKGLLKELPKMRETLKPLSCGAAHMAVYNTTGYFSNSPQEGSWCNVAWENFLGYQVGKDARFDCTDCMDDQDEVNRKYVDVMATTAQATKVPLPGGGFGFPGRQDNSGGSPGGYGGSSTSSPGSYGEPKSGPGSYSG